MPEVAAVRAEGVGVADHVAGEVVDCPDNFAKDGREQECTEDVLVDLRATDIGIAVESCSGDCSEPSAEEHSGPEIEHSGL